MAKRDLYGRRRRRRNAAARAGVSTPPANLVARVGTLAFAAGLGVAVTAGAGAAQADSPDSDGSSSASASSAETSPPDSDSAPSSGSTADEPTSSSQSSDTGSSGSTADEPTSSSEDSDTGSESDSDVAGEFPTTDELPDDGVADDVSAEATEPDTGDTTDLAKDGDAFAAVAPKKRSNPQPAAADDAADDTDDTDESPVDRTQPSRARLSAAKPADDDLRARITTVSVDAPPAATLAVSNSSSAAHALPLPARPGADAQVAVVGVIENFLGVLGGDLPRGTVDHPLLSALLAWARRQLIGLFYNRQPTATVHSSQTATGQITGAVAGEDPDGDPLRYTVIAAPTSGTVALGTNGTFTYTPDQALAATGGSDTFTVRVRDRGLRLLSRPGVTEVAVTVQVNARPSAGTPTVGAADENGAVRGWLNFTDREGNPLTYQVVSANGGTVTVGVAGDFVYTPSTAERVTAGLTPNVPRYNRFTVSATDGTSEPVVIEVDNVPVAPLHIGRYDAPIDLGTSASSLTFSLDGRHAFLTDLTENKVTVIDTVTNSPSTFDVDTVPYAVALSPDGAKAYLLDDGTGTIDVIDIASGDNEGTIRVGHNPTHLAITPDGGRLYTADTGDGTVSAISTATKSVLTTIPVGGNPYALVISPDGKRVYVTDVSAGTLSVIDTSTNTVVDEVVVVPTPTAVATGPDGKRLFLAGGGDGGEGVLTVIDTATTTAVGTPIPVGDSPVSVALSQDGSLAFVASHADNIVTVVDTATGAIVGDPIPVGDAPTAITVAHDGTKLYVAHSQNAAVSVITLTAAPPPPPDSAPQPAWHAHLVSGATAAQSGHTTGFDVINISNHAIKFTGYGESHLDDLQYGPVVGTILQPGDTAHFELYHYVVQQNPQFTTWEQVGGTARYEVTMSTNNWDQSDWLCNSSGGGSCKPLPQVGQQRAIVLMDQPGPNITIPADQAETQAAILNTLCGAGLASCRFTATREERVTVPGQGVGYAIYNQTGQPVTTDLTFTKIATRSSSVDVSNTASAKIAGIINVEMTNRYAHTWLNTATFTQTETLVAHPGSWARMQVDTPVTRTYGNFTATVAGTTFHVNDVYFDSPDPKGNAVFHATPTPIPGQLPTGVGNGSPGNGEVPPVVDDGTTPFVIINGTDKPITLTSSTPWLGEPPVQQPAVGTVLAPGSSTLFRLGSSQQVSTEWSDGTESYGVSLDTRDGTDWDCTSGSCVPLPETEDGQHYVVLAKPPGSVITVPASQPEHQAALLESLCGTGLAICRFEVTSAGPALGNGRFAGNSILNSLPTPVAATISYTQTETTTSVLDVSTKTSGTIAGIVSEAISLKYSYSWTDTDTNIQTLKTSVAPGSSVEVLAYDSVFRMTGNMTIQLATDGNVGNDRIWVLEDVVIDNLDPNGQGALVVSETTSVQ